MAAAFTNTGPVPLVIGDTTIAVGAEAIIADGEEDALARVYPAAAFGATIETAVDHYDALSYFAGYTSDERS